MDGSSVPTTESPAGAWQPLTFGGVAAFAQAPLSRLLLVEFLAALVAAASVVAFVGMAWAPAIQKAISQLPDGGEIRNGQLQWQGPGRLSLAATRFVALGVDMAESGELAPVADVQCLLGPTKAKVTLLFGVFSVAYPSRWIIPVNRTDLDPWWGAWKPAILAGTGVITLLALFPIWAVLAFVYGWAVRLLALVLGRQTTAQGCRRLAAAALMPGSLWLSIALVGYGLGRLELVGFLLAAAIHFVVGWIYLAFAPIWLPRKSSSASAAGNPFQKE